MNNNRWYARTIEETLSSLCTDAESGLTNSEAKSRLNTYGYNELIEKEKRNWWKQLVAQFQDFMVLILLVATLISALLGEYIDAGTILAIVIMNALLGFIQEYRAEKSIQALKKLASPTARVIRNQLVQRIPARELVPGDIMVFEAGDKPAADGRILNVQDLQVQEAALTGEAIAVRKLANQEYVGEIPLGDRRNMIFAGTVVVKGRGTAIVCNTGMSTEVGHIAGMIQETEDESTPLERRLEHLGKWLVWGCLAICLLVVFVGVIKGEPLLLMCMAGISLAVAAIPEGLPAIVTVALALGVQRMIRRNAIIRKLPAVETLGCTTVICTDKTGTLTENEMTVKQVYTSKKRYEVTGSGYELSGGFLLENKEFASHKDKTLEKCLEISVLCNNSILKNNNIGITGIWRRIAGTGKWSIEGDPTEGALVVAAAKAGIWRSELEKRQQRIRELPFESERRCMSVIYKRDNGHILYAKGAPDNILAKCCHYWDGEQKKALTEELREEILQINGTMASAALRILATAFRDVSHDSIKSEAEELEQELIFVGLVGMIDPPRKEAKEAISRCHAAGIQTVMITGDHPNTAIAIAKDLGIFHPHSHQCLIGIDMDTMTDEQLAQRVNEVTVYARVSPGHKLRVVKALRKKGHIVAMTGDGVNDAPAVKEADIGIAMGKSGTDVTKEASVMILADDNFQTIVAAVEEGRGIYDNIRKFIRYLLSCNLGEVLTMFISSLAGLPLPLLPVQILWVNLVTDGLPAMALGVDSHDPNIMRRGPRSPRESVFSRGLTRKILLRGLQIGLSTVGVFTMSYFWYQDLPLARTMAFCTLVFCQLFHVYDCRSEMFNVFEIGFFSNRYLLAATSCSVLMQLAVVYHSTMREFFGTTPLHTEHWMLIMGVSGWTFFLNGLRYFLKRFLSGKKEPSLDVVKER